ncbi:MAG TPA: glycosyltransferase family 2 protein [Pyrinomonadaceae bacterium]|nr:glycosyltransferase family 2 protein [Pyrinomonadaceae bacterium]
MRISVAMCTYNGADFLPAQLASIAEQTRPPDEIIVCDDASTDHTRAQLESFARTSPIPVSLYFSDQNAGSLKNFERAIGLCTGEVIALSDQDDVWRNDKLQVIEQTFRRHPITGLVFSDAEIVDKNLKPLGQRMWNEVGFDARKQKLMRNGRSLDVLVTGWTVTGATMAFRSEYVKLALPIPANIAMIHDGWIALTIAAVADVAFIEEPLIKYRQHERQQIGVPNRPVVQPERGLQAFESALRRRNSARDLHGILAALEERLIAQQNSFDCRRALAFAGNYSLHLDVRANLPRKRLSRVPRILRELLTMRYHEYANGFKSAAKDLVS